MRIRGLINFRALRSTLLILIGFTLIVTGLWVGGVALFGTLGGSAVGLFASGVAVLVLEGLSE
ncbi:hypothetical protein CLV43_114270 [Umezawaea tangerina]|uniref:Uncharacterized protein n=1 Tax=Umezawaea tangerina TaxID=84725 RepID=A0A2T0SPK1_9PSEU|nr:hypothetical protein CLV43_114270 [Umezawaea tangerina]